MTHEDIRHFFEERITYKPGYRFRVYRMENKAEIAVWLTSAPLPDADGINAEPSPIVVRSLFRETEINALPDAERRMRLHAETMIRCMELHEMDEWFRLDGAYVKDPHPEKKRLFEAQEEAA